MFDPNKIRPDFPIFNQPDSPALVYLDNASTTQKPIQVIDAVHQFYSRYNSNVHRGIYRIAEQATEAYESARDKIASLIGAPDRRNIVFTKSTTESVNLVAYSWARKFLKPGDEILVTEMEHHSNLVPWQLAALHTGATLKYIPITESGSLDLSSPEKYFTKKTKFVACTHQSNVLGTINPIQEIIRFAKSVNAVTLIDGAQFVPHGAVDVHSLDCDFYVFSGHKMMGPTGVGVLYGKQERFEAMDPFLGGGDMILSVSMERSTWNDIPYKFEAGTPNIAQVIGLGVSVDYINKIGILNFDEHIRKITQYAYTHLIKIPGLSVLGYHDHMDATTSISFNLNGAHPHDVAQFLSMEGTAIRAGHHCAQPIMEKLGLHASARASFYIYNTTNEIDFLISNIIAARQYFT